MRRRDFLGVFAGSIAAGRVASARQERPPLVTPVTPAARKGRIKQGVTRGVFGRGADNGPVPLEDCCR